MEKVREVFQTIYKREKLHTPVLPLETHVYPIQLNDETPSAAEVEVAVLRLSPLKAGGQIHLCAEHFQHWQRELYPRENSKTPPAE